MPQHQEESGRFSWFFVGAALGAAVALLYAPKAGKETREMLTQKTNESKDALTDSSKDLMDKGKDLYDRGRQIADDAAELFERGRRMVRG